MKLSVVFETHSWSEDNERGIASGWNAGALSVRGKALAAKLGDRRRADGIAAVFTSDLTRAVETAMIAFPGNEVPVFQDARLRECNYGKLNGCRVEELAGRRSQFIRSPFPGGQSYHDVVAAMGDFLNSVADVWAGRRILLIGHTATRWALDCLINGQRLEDLVNAPFGWQEGWEYTSIHPAPSAPTSTPPCERESR